MNNKGRGRSDKPKSGWVKPDGKPMRKRKGKFFPDEEIEKGKRRARGGSEKRDSGTSGRRRPEETSSRSGGRNPDRASHLDNVNEEVRLNKFIANTGTCSRREADELIIAGVISINGEVVTELGTKVQPGDVVKYNGESIKTERLVYVLLNKPKDFITTMDDPQERKTVMSLVSKACKERIYPVGRLDRNTTGLLLLTNDGDLTKKLTHPSYKIRKLYSVELDSNLTKEDMNRLSAGVELDDGVSKADQIAWENPDIKSKVGVELHSGKNRIVRRMFEVLGYTVKKLDRVVFAGLTKKDLPRGRWRFLTEMEVNMLKMTTGSKKRT